MTDSWRPVDLTPFLEIDHDAWLASLTEGQRDRFYKGEPVRAGGRVPANPMCGTPGGRRKVSALAQGGHPAMSKVRLPLKVNQFGGTCGVCGNWIEAGAGYVEKTRGKWEVFC